MRLERPRRQHKKWGYADFFDIRRKNIFLKIAELKPTDVLYDLGCGDASFLIYAVKKAKLRKAVGFENMKSRADKAMLKIKLEGLEERISIKDDFYEADLSKADVIFDMMPEGRYDLRDLYSRRSNIKAGTRLIKHDLPLIGYLPDKIEIPFYLMKFPLRKAKKKNHWASVILGHGNNTISQLWHELYYYGYEKNYSKKEIEEFASILSNRM